MIIRSSIPTFTAHVAAAMLLAGPAGAQEVGARGAVQSLTSDVGGPWFWLSAVLASTLWIIVVASMFDRPRPPKRARVAAPLHAEPQLAGLAPAVRRDTLPRQ